jgi:hypothetical protein
MVTRMRPRSLAPLVLLLALGCRPRGADSHALPGAGVGEEPTTITTSDPPPTPAADLSERPPGAIYRNELWRATKGGSAAYLLGQLGPEAYAPQGRFEGWVITRVWPADPELCAPGCDLVVGDILLSVNGSKLETPEQLSNALSDLDALERLDVTGIRGGEFFERSYAIVPDP